MLCENPRTVLHYELVSLKEYKINWAWVNLQCIRRFKYKSGAIL